LDSLFFSFLLAASGRIIAAEDEFISGSNFDGTQNGTIPEVEEKYRIDVSGSDASIIFLS
jgi:hypothetical protein